MPSERGKIVAEVTDVHHLSLLKLSGLNDVISVKSNTRVSCICVPFLLRLLLHYGISWVIRKYKICQQCALK